MKKILCVLGLIFIMGCGDNVKDAKNKDDSLLIGTWDLVTNTATKCYERLTLNSDKTFWWYDAALMTAGTWERNENTLNFQYTGRPWEIVKYYVDTRELSMVKVGIFKTFVHVPVNGYVSSCPK